MLEAKPWSDIPPCAGQREVAVFTPVRGVGRGGQLWGDWHQASSLSRPPGSGPLKDQHWEGLGAGGEGDDRGWDGWMASPTRWAWVWVNSRSLWWRGRPGMLQVMGSQRVRHNWVTELNWTEPGWKPRVLATGPPGARGEKLSGPGSCPCLKARMFQGGKNRHKVYCWRHSTIYGITQGKTVCLSNYK